MKAVIGMLIAVVGMIAYTEENRQQINTKQNDIKQNEKECNKNSNNNQNYKNEKDEKDVLLNLLEKT